MSEVRAAGLESTGFAATLRRLRLRAGLTQEQLAQLDRTLPVLVDGPQDLPDRQRTMRDTVTWSHDLLSEPARTAFRRMAVFAGGGTLRELEQAAGCRPMRSSRSCGPASPGWSLSVGVASRCSSR